MMIFTIPPENGPEFFRQTGRFSSGSCLNPAGSPGLARTGIPEERIHGTGKYRIGGKGPGLHSGSLERRNDTVYRREI